MKPYVHLWTGKCQWHLECIYQSVPFLPHAHLYNGKLILGAQLIWWWLKLNKTTKASRSENYSFILSGNHVVLVLPLFFSFWWYYGTLGHLLFDINFRINLAMSAKKKNSLLIYDWYCVESIDQLENRYINNNKSFLRYNWHVTWSVFTVYVIMCVSSYINYLIIKK